MGASSWVYYVPYQENIEQAFQVLRQHIFETDNYDHFWNIMEYERLEDALCAEHEVDHYDREAVERLVQEKGPIVVPPAKTIEEVLEKSEAEGTHSILDVSRLIYNSSYFTDINLPDEIFEQFMNEGTPSRAVVETLVFHEEVWRSVNGWVKVGGRKIFGISKEIEDFLTAERPKRELVEALLVNEEIWIKARRLIATVITVLADRTRRGCMMPFSPELLIRYFTTEKPSRAQVEAAVKLGNVFGCMSRWTGRYAIIYQDDVPQEIVFAGRSGD